MDQWLDALRRGRSEAAWDRFLERYRRLIFATIRHYARDHDDVMDIFARVCEDLRESDFRKLREWADAPSHRARFSTWLVTVVRHLAIDWYRHRDGRRRLSAVASRLSPLRRRMFELVFVEGRSHVECYELIRSGDAPSLSFGEFLAELRATYAAVSEAGKLGHLLSELGGPAPLEIDPEAPRPDAPADYRDALDHALESLTAEDRMTLTMYVVDGLPASHVARVVGLPNAKTVYNRVYRALSALRVLLERAGIGPEDL